MKIVTLPYLTLNLINNSYILLLPLTTPKKTPNVLLVFTKCYKSPIKMRGYPRYVWDPAPRWGPFPSAKSTIFVPGGYKTMHFLWKTYTWATWPPHGCQKSLGFLITFTHGRSKTMLFLWETYTLVTWAPPRLPKTMHFMNVRNPCWTYVMAGGWGDENNNRNRTLPHQTPSQ